MAQSRCTPFNCCLLPFLITITAVLVALLWPVNNAELVNAIKKGDVSATVRLVTEQIEELKSCTPTATVECLPVHIDSIDCGGGRSVLHVASQHSQLELMHILVDLFGASPQAIKPNDMRQPIHLAAAYGTLETVQALVDTYHVPVDVEAYDSWTPLLYAVLWSNVDITEYLLGKGADPNAAVRDGLSALQLSIVYSDVRIPPLLVEAGATLLPSQRYYDDYIAVKRGLYLQNSNTAQTQHVADGDDSDDVDTTTQLTSVIR